MEREGGKAAIREESKTLHCSFELISGPLDGVPIAVKEENDVINYTSTVSKVLG